MAGPAGDSSQPFLPDCVSSLYCLFLQPFKFFNRVHPSFPICRDPWRGADYSVGELWNEVEFVDSQAVFARPSSQS